MAWWQKIINSRSSLFFYCAVLFIAGIFSGYFIIVPHVLIFIALIALLLALIIILSEGNKNFAMFSGSCVLMFLCSFVFGFWRYNLTLPDYNNSAKIYHYSSTSAELIGEIANVDARIDGQKLTLKTEALQTKSGNQPVSGLVLISQPLQPEFSIKEKARVKCFLERPGMIEDFNYGAYLSKDNIFAVCSFADVSVISRPGKFNPVVLFFEFKKYLTRSLNSAVSEPEVSLLRGILLGDGRGLPADQALIFSDLGLTHIIAISGDHIAIMTVALLQLLMLLGLSRPKAFWPLAVIISFYVALVGAPASAVRAAIMALAVMYAQKIGRASQIKNVLILAAGLMILVNPRILLSDVGFQLSFMAVWGLSYISPVISAKVQSWPDYFRAKEILVATLSAQIATLPLLLYYFGKLSLISLVANILILPVIPFLTIWGLLNLSVAAIYLPLGRIMGWVSWLMAAYWLATANVLHQVPFGFFKISGFSWLMILLYYSCLFFLLWRKQIVNFFRQMV